MGLSTTTQFRPFGPIFPSFSRFSRSCPYSFSSFSSGGHRFRGKAVPGVVVDLQRREEKMGLVHGNYSGFSVQEGKSMLPKSTPNAWLNETKSIRERRNSFMLPKNDGSADGSCYSVGQDTVTVQPTCVLTKDNQLSEDQMFPRNGALHHKSKFQGMQESFIREQKTDKSNNVDVEDKKNYIARDTIQSNGTLAQKHDVRRNGTLRHKSRFQGRQAPFYREQKSENSNNVAVEDKENNLARDVVQSNGPNGTLVQKQDTLSDNKEVLGGETRRTGIDSVNSISTEARPDAAKKSPTTADAVDPEKIREKLNSIYDKILVVDSVHKAKKVVQKLTEDYKHLVHACDTEVANIDVKQETPIDHGEVICFSIYSGPGADFGNGKSCIWVDVLDGGGRDLLLEFAPFFEDASIKKVWHNYSFDSHVIENYGLSLSGFHADTMHMARLWNSSRRTEGGYSLEALTSCNKVMSRAKTCYTELIGKISMKTIFGKKKLKKDGTEGKTITVAPVEELQRNERKLWICYSGLDSISTLQLYESLRSHLYSEEWKWDLAAAGKTMFDFYREYWRPFGELLVRMEAEGMLVDRAYLVEIEKVAKAEQEIAVNRFRNWASKHCPDAKYMNVGSDLQLRQLFFGGTINCKNADESLPGERTFQVPNPDKVTDEGKKASKFRSITLQRIGKMKGEIFTSSGWPSVSGDALKILAGKVSAEYDYVNDADEVGLDDDIAKDSKPQEMSRKTPSVLESVNKSDYGTALEAFDTVEEGIEACHAIASLCEVCSIDSLISNFILPLQGTNVSGKGGRIHCSLNINTETGRLSARRPNLQNQPALEKDRYKIRQAFVAAPGNSLIVADYGQLELRILAHLANCKSMLEAFKAGGDFHSRTAMNMYPHIRMAVERGEVLLEWEPRPGEDTPPVPLLKDAFGSERRKAKMLNFSIAYGKTPIGLARDWKVTVDEARKTVNLWYNERKEVLHWQELRKKEANERARVHTLLGRARHFPQTSRMSRAQKSHIERAAINTPVQGSAADVAMCAMLEISKNQLLKELGWKLLLQVHDEVILEGPTESAEEAKAIVVDCMSKPFNGKNILKVDLSVDAKCAQNWYSAK